jgi:hypothetical protein
MSPEKPKIYKPKLNKDILKQNGINFLEHVHESEELPDWIRPIPQHLLRFHERLSYNHMKDFEWEFNAFRKSGPDRKEARTARWSLMPPELETDPIWIQQERFTMDKGKPAGKTSARFQDRDKIQGTEQITESKTELKICHNIRKRAIRLRNDGEAETTWIDFLHNDIFRRFDKVYSYASTYE